MIKSNYETFCESEQPRILNSKSKYTLSMANAYIKKIAPGFSDSIINGFVLAKNKMFKDTIDANEKSEISLSDIINWLKLQKCDQPTLYGCIFFISKVFERMDFEIINLLNNKKYWL